LNFSDFLILRFNKINHIRNKFLTGQGKKNARKNEENEIYSSLETAGGIKQEKNFLLTLSY